MDLLPPCFLVKRFDCAKVALPGVPGIYFIHCESNGRVYIGSAIDIRNRFYKHRLSLNKGSHHSIHLQRAHDKYGASSFMFGVIELIDREHLITREQFFIDNFVPKFNTNPIAGSNLGRKMSEAQKLKLRIANLGKKLTPEARAIAIKNLRPNPGFSHSLETRLKMSATRLLNPPMGMKGKKHTMETLVKIAAASEKTYFLISPNGRQFKITNLAKFCRKHGLIKFHLYAVNSGSRKSHNGWTKDTSRNPLGV